MKIPQQLSKYHQTFWMASVFSATMLLASCGGGGTSSSSVSSVGSGGTGAGFSGPISGFGSIIVNGVRLDDSSATVTLDDDSAGTSADLKLGMMVEIEGSKNDDGITGKAKTIASQSEIRGPVTVTPITGAKEFKVLGLTITVTASTVFEGINNGIAGLSSGTMVEIHGIPNGADGVIATRIETTGNNEERLTGVVQNLNKTAKTFTLHGTVINYGAAAADKVPANLANDIRVRIKGQLITPVTTEPGTITATRVQIKSLDRLKINGQQLELEGVVTKFNSATDFEVNGNKVKMASNASVEGTIAAGSLVEVNGLIDASGVLIATKVEVKNGNKAESNELHGLISNVTSNSFTLRGVTVTFDPNTVRLERLNLNGLINGIRVEVKGSVSASGNSVMATSIKLED